MAHAIFFYVFSTIAIISAIMVTASKNTVHSVFFSRNISPRPELFPCWAELVSLEAATYAMTDGAQPRQPHGWRVDLQVLQEHAQDAVRPEAWIVHVQQEAQPPQVFHQQG